MRVAFLTPEFVTEYANGGGLGHYLDRMTRALVAAGHEAEVFVPGRTQPPVVWHSGVRVERVAVDTSSTVRLAKWLASRVRADSVIDWIQQSRALAHAMEDRHHREPFDFVQSADFQATGLCLRRSAGRPHLVRCSTTAHVYDTLYANRSIAATWQRWIEWAAIRRADRAYAPSRFIADALRNGAGLAVEVIRPPAWLQERPAPPCAEDLPERFLVHFGQFLRRKGTLWLAEALAEAFRRAPSLRMVWIGHDSCGELADILKGLGPARDCVRVLAPLPAPQLYEIVSRAEAAVLPSLADNLPNTVVESLLLGVPVIGTRGASIDELVDEGVTGTLVPAGDVQRLADALVAAWHGQTEARKGFVWPDGRRTDMKPDRAVAALLGLAAGARS